MALSIVDGPEADWPREVTDAGARPTPLTATEVTRDSLSGKTQSPTAPRSTQETAALLEGLRAIGRLEPGASLRGASLIGQDLSGVNLAGADLRGTDLSRANLTKANLAGAKLQGAVLFAAVLDEAELLAADLRGANLTKCSAIDAGFGGANLEDANLFDSTLKGASFTQSDLTAVDFRAADLTDARLRQCSMRGSDLSRSTLRGADLTDSDATGASFDRADLRDTTLAGLRGASAANWVGVDIMNVDFCGAYLVRRQILDQNYLHEFRQQGRLARVSYWIWWATSDCGRSFARWGLWTVALAIGFGGLYQLVDLDLRESPDSWMTHVYFSIVTLTTLGYGDIVPVSATARLITLVEVVTGYVMLGGLLGIFANKMARRAE